MITVALRCVVAQACHLEIENNSENEGRSQSLMKKFMKNLWG